jgi:hypothetical protein
MDYVGPISSEYGKGVVRKGRREKTEVYHADSGDEAGTKIRFNLYEGAAPEEYAIRRDREGRWFLHNKTQTRERRKDIPSEKPTYREIPIDKVDPSNEQQAMMPKLDGAHVIVDMKAGRAPRVFSYRRGKKTGTELIEHTHKMPEMLKRKVPKQLDGTILRAEVIGVDKSGKSIPSEGISGMLNAKVWNSRAEQERRGVRLKVFPFSVVRHKGRDLDTASFDDKIDILRSVAELVPDFELPELAVTTKEKLKLLNDVKGKVHPLTDEGVVLVDKNDPRPIKAVITPDFDVHIRKVHRAQSTSGEKLDRAGAVSYSWTEDGPIVGRVGGFRHGEGRDMMEHPEKYIGRVAKVRARKVFKKGNQLGALFQPRFSGWHLDKGEV